MLLFILALIYLFIYFFNQLMAVADCASRLKRLSKALDLNDLGLDNPAGSVRQKLARLYVVGLELDIKESLLEACGLVLLANSHLNPHPSGKHLQKERLICFLFFFFFNIVQHRPYEE